MLIRLDLHIHSLHSPDGRMTIDEIVAVAQSRGLDGVAICDHDRVLTEKCSYPDFLVIPGVEFSTERGHLLGLFVSDDLKAGDFQSAVAAIHGCGGLAVMAHPFEHSTDITRLDSVAGELDGAEVWNGRAERKNHEANAMALKFADTHGLRHFAGSDAHLPAEIGNGSVTLEVDELTPGAVKRALMTAPVTTSGRRGEAKHVAASQLTKLRKRKAGPKAYCKWALFATKCWAQDVFTGRGGSQCL